MKQLLISLSFFCITSCISDKLDMQAAIKTADEAIRLISDQQYDELTELCTSDFNNSEPEEVRREKISQIIKATGKVISYNLTDSIRENKTGEPKRIILKYKVKHDNTTTTETYTVVKEEGKYLLANFYVTNQ